LTTLSIRTPQEFGAFPTILLTTTLTRLVLNVATTRLVLTRGGEDRLMAAGGVIKAFGEFVAGDQVIIGVILFSILVVIQFVVITRGATRISEVAARFMLDGLPGRQMAIDADLHAGLIDQQEAHRRREEVYRQSDFFGAMDGAGKFVRGDAVAGVVILLVNIAGGLFLGTVNHGMSPGEAINVFTKLTIGDGLVSQVPAFLISLAAGLIVTRSSSSTDLNRDVIDQLFSRPGVLGTAAVFLGLMMLTPLPKLPLLALGGGLGVGAWLLAGSQGAGTAEEAAPGPRSRTEEAALGGSPPPRARTAAAPAKGDGESVEPGSERMEDLLHVDPLELEIGYRLISLADPNRGGDLLGRLKTVRQRVAREMGLIVPRGRRAGRVPGARRLGRRRRPLRRDRRRPCRRAPDPRAGGAAARAGAEHRPQPGR
jgi:flagellar biosynthesis protein FlhA